MTELLYQKDSYLKDFEATVKAVQGRNIVLDMTAFYPESGGQPDDAGKLVKLPEGRPFKIRGVKKLGTEVVHEVDEDGLKVADKVHGWIDWERRYTLMRAHTAAHLLAGQINRKFGSLVTGKQLGLDKSRIDFNLDEFDRSKFVTLVSEANEAIKTGAEIRSFFLPREKAMEIPGMVKLAGRLPPTIPELRIVEITRIDTQACGGTHLKNISEIGEIILLDLENRGKSNRRLYFTVK